MPALAVCVTPHAKPGVTRPERAFDRRSCAKYAKFADKRLALVRFDVHRDCMNTVARPLQ